MPLLTPLVISISEMLTPKEPKLMNKFNKGLGILNTMDIHDLNDLNGRFVKFNV